MTGPVPATPHASLGFKEFVALVAGLMMINALGIDIMLPALPNMARALGITVENRQQFIIAAYVVGFGSMQLVYGPLSDRFGRRPVLFLSMGLFVVTSIAATFATSFATIIVARAAQGVGAAASRVLTVSIVRDCYSGRQMARVMSLAFMVFLTVPILAPSIGQGLLLVGPWQGIFYFLAAFGAVLTIWAGLRLPETLHPEFRRPLEFRGVADAMWQVLSNRYALGYTVASAVMFGSLMGFLNSVPQIFADTFHRPGIFTFIFAISASAMGFASYYNSRVVERLGTRRVSHTALLCFIAIAAAHATVASAGLETIVTFTLFQSATMACFALAGSNFGSMAMEPVGHIAGTASSVQGTISTIGGALVGLAIGQSFDGTTVPIAVGYLLCGAGTLAVVLWVERGKLFRPHVAAAA